LAELARIFTKLTGAAATRSKAAAAAGRTIAYPDCRRDLDVTVGQPLLDQLRDPLGVLLDMARWFTEQLAAEVSAALTGIYRQRRTGHPGLLPVTTARTCCWPACPAACAGSWVSCTWR